jgi:hypothetical protein
LPTNIKQSGEEMTPKKKGMAANPSTRNGGVSDADVMSKEGHMPTPEALENLRRAEEGMKLAQQELLTYLERPDRRFSAEEREENRRLLKRVSQSLEEYFQAFEQAC